VINGLISKALEEAANPEAVKQARRFIFRKREIIYSAGATSPRALQLITTFPVLALSIFDPGYHGDSWHYSDRRAEAVKLVKKGAPLKQVADLMQIPMALRKVKPGGAELALRSISRIWDARPVYAYIPETLPRMNGCVPWIWHRCLERSSPSGLQNMP
jgi:hypothetical protein